MGWNASGVSSFTHHRRRFLSACLGLVAGIRLPIGPNALVAASATAGVPVDEGGHAAFHQAGELLGGAGPVGDIARAGSRSALAAIPASAGAVRYLTEAGREGMFVFSDKDRSAEVASDALQGLYVAAAAGPGGSRGAWVRQWDGVHGYAEWFGAIANNPAVDNQPAIQAAVDALPTVQLRGGDYYTASKITIVKNGSSLIGSGQTQTDQKGNDVGFATRIVCTSATETILQIGPDSLTNPIDLTECVTISDFSVDRSVNPFTPASGVEGCIGIENRWIVNCHFERVFSINSCRGWYFYGTVQHYVKWCGSLRERDGSNAANDVFIGFHVNQNAPAPYNGGNASLSLHYCRCFPTTGDATPSLTYSAGIRFDGGWVDCFIDGFECGSGIGYGIHGVGFGSGSTDYRGENLWITNCILDPGGIACISLQDSGPRTAITIANNYMACGSTSTALILSQLFGAVTVANNQLLTAPNGSTGISAAGVNGLRCEGNIITDFAVPISLQNVTNFVLHDTIAATSGPSAHAAITTLGTMRGTIDCIINGVANAYTMGVNLSGGANRLIEVAFTNIEPGSVTAKKLYHNGVQITTTGAFGTNCLASGIMA